ncbi:glycosyltransferase N-terminal domain-containing protein [Roseovarius salis]|uniref:3-deoxy-D-manno-octulosonic acid transferase n=1 Tax=Roseovarius salis TaxID=3376063 RepID=UPI0037C5CB59
MRRPPLPVGLYRAAANLIAPLAYRRVAHKLSAQGTPRRRLPERMGRASAERPGGRLVWFHAASVGESVSVLRLIARMGAGQDDLCFLLTSGTATSAQVVAQRLPPRTVHQFAPLDSARAVRRFLDHWRPDAAIFVESELWPQMLTNTHARGIPMALVNARISERSARAWKRFPSTARFLMGHFRMIHCQDARTAEHLQQLGLPQARSGQNLKSLSSAPPHDAAALAELKARIGARPLWLASSTHPGEDEIALAAHRAVLADQPGALLILVPRHPERAGSIATLIEAQGFATARRSAGGGIDAGTQVYLADTLGETGLWYALSPITCLFGSFVPVGGHNPYEPAHAGTAILHGPLYANIPDSYAALDAAGGAWQVADADALARAVRTLLRDRDTLNAMRRAAGTFARSQQDGLDEFAGTLSTALSLR